MQIKSVPIITRQQRRQAERTGNTAEYAKALNEIHYRLNVTFECMRMLGLTEGQLVEAQENIKARLKILGMEVR